MLIVKLNSKQQCQSLVYVITVIGYISVKGTITVDDTSASGAAASNTNKKVIFQNCAPFTNCISELNNTNIVYSEYSNANV